MAPISHVFSSPQADVADPTLVRPSDWNSVHAYTLQDAVSLSGNTAGALANISSGTLYLAGGNNVTLSQNGNSVTVSAANSGTAPPIGTAVKGVSSIGSTGTVTRFAPEDHQHAGLHSINVGGNTAGASSAGAGSFMLAGGDNVTLSGATAAGGMTLSIMGATAAGGGAPIATAVKSVASANSVGTITRYAGEDHAHAGLNSISVVGNTSGNVTAGAGSLVLAGGNNVTLSGATAAGGMTLSISAANETQTVPPIGTAVKGVSSIGSTGTVTRFAPEDHQHAGLHSINVGGNTAGATSAGAGSFLLAGGDNVTLSGATAAGGMTLSIMGATAAGGAGFSAGMSNLGNTLGTSGTVGSRLVFAGGSNVTLSQSVNGASATLTVSAGFGRSFTEIGLVPAVPVYSFTRGPQQPVFFPFTIDHAGLSAKTIRQVMSRAAGVSLVATLGVGFYTMVNATSLALVSSTTQNYSLASSASWNQARVYDVTGLSNLTFSAGHWWMGLHLSATATGQGNLLLMGAVPAVAVNGVISPGTESTQATTASVGVVPFYGMLSFSSASLPSNVAQSDMLGADGSTAGGLPYVAIRGI